MTSRTAARQHAHELREQAQREETRTQRKRRLITISVWTIGILAVVGLIGGAMLTSRPQETAATRAAPTFTLPTTAGKTVSLADFRGKNVILYFSEGAGCQSCLLQMAKIEQQQAAFDKANIVVLPIVMNTRDQIAPDMAANQVKTPFLLDDGTVSTAYGTIGKGMHAGLPGHSFVVIDAQGTQRWYGEYPSMWLNPTDLLTQADKALAG